MKFFLLIISALLVLSCEHLAEQHRQELAYRCSNDGAFETGVNEARAQKPMNIRHALASCDSSVVTGLTEAYRKGYLSVAPAPVVVDRSTNLNFGGGGYNSKYNVEKKCESAYGQTVCGYNCLSAYGEVKCGRQPSHTCVSGYGHVKCGLNCVAKYGEITCAEE